MLVKTKFANIINIAAKKEIIPELLQSNCNPKKIFEVVSNYLDNPNKIDEQKNYKLIIGKNYPKPIIDLGAQPFLLAETFKVVLLALITKQILKIRNMLVVLRMNGNHFVLH